MTYNPVTFNVEFPGIFSVWCYFNLESKNKVRHLQGIFGLGRPLFEDEEWAGGRLHGSPDVLQTSFVAPPS